MRAQILTGIRLECFTYHQRAEIGTTNADVDDVADWFAGVSGMLAIAHRIGEAAHQSQHALHIGHDVLAVYVNGLVGMVAQCSVQRGTLFGGIDFFATEHAFDVSCLLYTSPS